MSMALGGRPSGAAAASRWRVSASALVVALVVPLLVSADAVSAAVPTMRAPVIDGDWPDPEIVLDSSARRYRAYATNFTVYGVEFNVPVRSSPDLEDWTQFDGDALPTLPTWATRGSTWSPGVALVGGAWNLYFTAKHRATGYQCIGVARSSSSLGPFAPTSSPLVCQHEVGGSIDASPFLDPRTGHWWLHWKSDENAPDGGDNPRLWARRLTSDGREFVGDATAILTDQRSVATRLIENPDMTYDGGRYWLTFSLDRYTTDAYSAHVVRCDGPAGPCVWPDADGPVWLSNANGAVGPGGTSFFHDSYGRTLVAFHSWRDAVGYPSGRRATHIEPVSFDGPAGAPRLRPDQNRHPVAFRHDRFAIAAHQVFLGRNPSTAVRTSWTSALLGGASRGPLIRGLSTSNEWLGREIEDLYRKALGRASDASGKAYWRQRVIDGLPLSAVGANFYSSQEFYLRSGSTPRGFVTALYREIIHREPDTSGFDYWVGVTSRGTDRFIVADSFYRSIESRRDRVRGLYRTLLGRNPDAGGWAYWADQLQSADDVRLAEFLASSDEFYRRAQR